MNYSKQKIKMEVNSFFFQSSTSSLYKFENLISEPYGKSTIKVTKIDTEDIYEITIINQDENHSFYTNDLWKYPIKMKKSFIQIDGRIVLHTFQKHKESDEHYLLGIVHENGIVKEIIFEIPEKFMYIIYLP